MKFLVSKDLSYSTLLAYLMGFVVFSIILYLVMDMVLHAYVIGADVVSVHHTLFGNAEAFEEPILIDSLLLQVHIDLFTTLFALLILTSIYIRLYEKTKVLKLTVHILFVLGIVTPACLLAAYFGLEVFVYVWTASFWLWHALALFLSVMILGRLKSR